MLIPEGFGQANILMGGLAAPNGAECTFGIEMPLPTPPPDEAALAVYSSFENRVGPFLVDDLALFGARVKYGPNETGVSGEYLAPSIGGDSGEPEAPQVAALVKKITVDGGRAGRGRFYLPGIRETRVQPGGSLVGTFRDDLQAGIDLFFSDLEDADYHWVVLHGETSPLEEPSRVLSFQVESMVATQRRRLGR